jgi:hypothetical protein
MKVSFYTLLMAGLACPVLAGAQSFQVPRAELPAMVAEAREARLPGVQPVLPAYKTQQTAKRMVKWVTYDLKHQEVYDSLFAAYGNERGSEYNWQQMSYDHATMYGPSNYDSVSIYKSSTSDFSTLVSQYSGGKWVSRTSRQAGVNEQKITRLFGSNGQLQEDRDSVWQSGSWVVMSHAKHWYNYKGKDSVTQIYSPGGSSGLQLDQQVAYSYDAAGNVVQSVTSLWSGSWSPLIQADYIYDAQNRELSQTIYYNGGSGMQAYSKDSFQYNAAGHPIFYAQYANQGNGLTPFQRWFRYPNASGCSDSINIELYSDQGWQGYSRWKFAYDTDGDVTEHRMYTYVNGVCPANPDYSIVYTYQPYTVAGVSNVVAQATAYQLYPNPAVSSLVLKAEAGPPAGATILIGNMSGQLVYEGRTDGSGTTAIGIASLAQGQYWIAVRDAKGGVLYRSRFTKI